MVFTINAEPLKFEAEMVNSLHVHDGEGVIAWFSAFLGLWKHVVVSGAWI